MKNGKPYKAHNSTAGPPKSEAGNSPLHDTQWMRFRLSTTMKRILVTGITGFAGSFLAERLQQNANSEVFGTYQSAERLANVSALKNNITLRRVNLLDEKVVRDLISQVQPAEVYHLAALTSPSQSHNTAAETINNNTIAQIHLFEAIIAAGITPKMLIISSGDVYGRAAQTPLTEDTPMHPTNPYAVSKITQECLEAV